MKTVWMLKALAILWFFAFNYIALPTAYGWIMESLHPILIFFALIALGWLAFILAFVPLGWMFSQDQWPPKKLLSRGLI